jgi:uncharacterized protein (TIGR00299 family) protein
MSSPSSADAALTLPASPASLAIHLDLIGGIAGDMFVAALVDALPALEAPILRELARVQPPGAAPAAFSPASTGGLRARRFGLATPLAAAPAAPRSRFATGVADGVAFRQLQRELETAALSDGTRRHALALLALLGDAEAAVHGIPRDDVHFHELADWDSRLDLVAAGCIAALLEGAQWSASSLPLGGGTVDTAHGALPVPAPATTVLLLGYPWHDDGVPGERVTPTGAAILRHLVAPAACGGARGTGRLVAAGGGAGTRTLRGRPNLLRALVMESVGGTRPRDDAPRDGDAVTIIEFDIDDMTGEEIGLAAERLRAQPGALDVSVGSRAGKKGRPVADFRILAREEAAEEIARACFAETTTLGLRMRDERRRLLARDEASAVVDDDTALRVKVARRPGGATTAKAEHDDVAGRNGLRVRREARAAAVDDVLKRRKR